MLVSAPFDNRHAPLQAGKFYRGCVLGHFGLSSLPRGCRRTSLYWFTLSLTSTLPGRTRERLPFLWSTGFLLLLLHLTLPLPLFCSGGGLRIIRTVQTVCGEAAAHVECSASFRSSAGEHYGPALRGTRWEQHAHNLSL